MEVGLEEALAEPSNVIARRAGLANCRFMQGDVTDLSMEEEFDLVESVENLEHVEVSVATIGNLRAALVPGRTLVLYTPSCHRRWPSFRRRMNLDVLTHVRPGYHAEELGTKPAEVGFAVVAVRHTHGFLKTVTKSVSYMISGANKRIRSLYTPIFPFLLAISYLDRSSRLKSGAGILARARRPYAVEEPAEAPGLHAHQGSVED